MAYSDTTTAKHPSVLAAAFLHHLYEQFRQNLVLTCLCVLLIAGTYLAAVILQLGFEHSVTGYIQRALFYITPIVFSIFVLRRIIYVGFVQKPPVIMTVVLRDIGTAMTQPERYARMIWLLLVPTIGFIAFVNLKVYIPEIIPFYADDFLINLERTLHFGTLPQDWLAFILDIPSLVSAIDFSYKLWYIIAFVMWGWAALGAEDAGWRRQYILSLMLCWSICGMLLATLMASVGPVFYDALVSPGGPYVAHMAKLGEINATYPLMAVEIQTKMTELYLNEPPSGRIGISAMPSLHNTLAVLFAIAGYRIHRLIGHALAVYAALIFIGSIVLGWHYALDGYAGLILAIGMWKLAGWLLKVQDRVLKIDPASTL